MTDYHPVKGDRVRVTRVFEGIVGEVGCTGIRLDNDREQTRFDFQSPFWAKRGMVTQSFEKLADPEPEWVHGDHISLKGGTPQEFYHLIRKHYIRGNFWEDLYGNEIKDDVITTEWNAGAVTILYKADS